MEGMCDDVDGICVAAYHDCPSNGVSTQVDSTGIVITPEEKHNSIVLARCFCLDDWSGAGCTEPPPPPPTEEPWPDPYAGMSGAGRRRGSGLAQALGLAIALLGACFLLR